MDPGGFDDGGGFDAGNGGGFGQPKKKLDSADLPADLPRSLDDRRHVPTDLVPETELYDGWQGWCFPPPHLHPPPFPFPPHVIHTIPHSNKKSPTTISFFSLILTGCATFP